MNILYQLAALNGIALIKIIELHLMLMMQFVCSFIHCHFYLFCSFFRCHFHSSIIRSEKVHYQNTHIHPLIMLRVLPAFLFYYFICLFVDNSSTTKKGKNTKSTEQEYFFPFYLSWLHA